MHIVQHIIASSQVEFLWQFYDVGTLTMLKEGLPNSREWLV